MFAYYSLNQEAKVTMKNNYLQEQDDIWIFQNRIRDFGNKLICPSYIEIEDFDVANSIKGTWILDYDRIGTLPYVYNPQTGLYLHREIMRKMHGEEKLKGMVVDHIDGNRLNNRRNNLRLLTNAENLACRRKRTEKPVSDPFGLQGMYIYISNRAKGQEIKHYIVYVNSILIGRFGPDCDYLANVTWQVASMLLNEDKSISEVHKHLTRYGYSEELVNLALTTVKKNISWNPPE